MYDIDEERDCLNCVILVCYSRMSVMHNILLSFQTSIEFTIPDSLIKETLELMRLDKFG